jgi:hypothetical protein
MFADTHAAASKRASAATENGVRIVVTPTIMRPALMTPGAGEIFWDD